MAGLAGVAAAAACAQGGGTGEVMVVSSSQPAVALDTVEGAGTSQVVPGQIVPGQIVREIDDPSTGDRWLLVRNDQDPGGPGRLVLAGIYRSGLNGRAAGQRQQAMGTGILPVIRAGDRLTVVEHTAVVDAVLEARALGTAVRGAGLDVRLTIGGRVMRAVALGPGRAELEPQYGVEP